MQGVPPDQIGDVPIGHAPAVASYQIQVLWKFPPPGTVVDQASDNITSKILHVPMKETENPMLAAPTA